MKGNPKVFVGLSGGVDSAVSAALLKHAGFDVTGVFIKVWHPEFALCNWKEERRDAMRIAATLDIPFLTLDCEAEYKKYVVDYMLSEYAAGRTPNPDVMCNTYIKFGSFLNDARKRGADFIATGHYAVREERREHGKNLFLLKEAKDTEKEQSYFLWTLTQDQLSHSFFPVGKLEKKEVRKLALRFNIPVASKKDSQGLCFMGKVDIPEFLKMYLNEKPGDVVDVKGNVIGRHDGAYLYTIGQRHGFTITSKGVEDKPVYVVSKDITLNTITVSTREEEKKLYSATKAVLSDVHWIAYTPLSNKLYQARFRYHQKPQEVTIEQKGGGAVVHFTMPQQSMSSGQSLVVYDGKYCMGGGIIANKM